MSNIIATAVKGLFGIKEAPTPPKIDEVVLKNEPIPITGKNPSPHRSKGPGPKVTKVKREPTVPAKRRSKQRPNVKPKFTSRLILDAESSEVLKQCFTTHDIINEYVKELLDKNPKIEIGEVKTKVVALIAEKQLPYTLTKMINLEIYYIIKKTKEGKRPRTGRNKYLVFKERDTSNKSYTFNPNGTMMMVDELGIMMKLDTPLENIPEDLYYHLSLSTTNIDTLEDLTLNIFY